MFCVEVRNQSRLSTCLVRSLLYLEKDSVDILFRVPECYLFRRRTFFRVFQKPHKDIQGYQLTTVFSTKYQLTVNPIRTLWKVDGDNDECI